MTFHSTCKETFDFTRYLNKQMYKFKQTMFLTPILPKAEFILSHLQTMYLHISLPNTQSYLRGTSSVYL